ncbi:lipocalin family protein [Microscilla marina]|uniref:Lipoprotein, putative n=1 Tax=Microscilla marina ATCC 23134 TaxID=313606 RepID=A1ZXQ1_MICM2|nr:lipocalin family protein [Microscilla marina]EAY24829.1 lipoprotein, putative [Microscilla marina ATCC 23134]
MKRTHLFLVLVAMVAVFSQSCKKKNDDNGPVIENTELLKAWKVSNALEGTLDVTAEFSQYRLTLANDGTTKSYTLVDRSGTSTTGTWALSTDKTSLTLTPSTGTAITYSAVSFSATELKYQGSTTGKGGSVTINFTLVPA